MIRVVTANKVFRFRKLCPYCGANLHYTVTGWLSDDETKYPRKLKKRLKKKHSWPLWIADNIESQCQSEPENWDSEEWEDWINQHSDMPYVHQLPVDQRIKRLINKRFRFDL